MVEQREEIQVGSGKKSRINFISDSIVKIFAAERQRCEPPSPQNYALTVYCRPRLYMHLVKIVPLITNSVPTLILGLQKALKSSKRSSQSFA